MKRCISIYILVCFIVTGQVSLCPVQAQDFVLPQPGTMVHLSPAFNPPVLKGIKVHPDNPFRFDFILDKGDSNLDDQALKDESTKLIKYFLASLTTPEKDLWVNLSPYEKDRIIPESFGQTEMGRDLLAQDYLLKQITASLIYPEDEVGKKFWKRIYKEAQERFGTTNIPMDTFNKVWIVPEKAIVYENGKTGTAYVVESHLKVMLEKDYLALEENLTPRNDTSTEDLGSKIIREVVIPELNKEVNEGRNFSPLRQIYHSLILAMWYKKKIKDSILSRIYSDKNKVQGINIDDPKEKEKIYQKYLQAFKKGAYNYIKEEWDSSTQNKISRKYFSGGMGFDAAQLSKAEIFISNDRILPKKAFNLLTISVDINPIDPKMSINAIAAKKVSGSNSAMVVEQDLAQGLMEHPEIKSMIADFFAKGYPLMLTRRLIYEHLRRLIQREKVNLNEQKWIQRLWLAVEWNILEKPKYDFDIINTFGPSAADKESRVKSAALRFNEVIRHRMRESGNKFYIYSGGSGVGKSTIWTALKKMPAGKAYRKLVMYTTRDRRADEDVDFRDDIEDGSDEGFSVVLNLILDGSVGDISKVNVDNIQTFFRSLKQVIAERNVVISDKAWSKLDKILDLKSIGNEGKRGSISPQNKSIQDMRISLAERIGRLANGKVRVFGEFEGLTYYFISVKDLKALETQGEVQTFIMGNTLMQGISIKEVELVLNSVGSDIVVLETTPEIARVMNERFDNRIPMIFISPFGVTALRNQGGSTNTIETVERVGKTFVRKKVSKSLERDRRKFSKQIKWLQGLPSSVQEYFPYVDATDLKNDEATYYDMPLYAGRTLTKAIISDGEDEEFVFAQLTKIMKIWKERILPVRIHETDARYAWGMIDGIMESFDLVGEKSAVLRRLMEAPYIIINGIRYNNPRIILESLKANDGLMKKLIPPRMFLIHGDFHFDNILLLPDGSFKLLDPRGDIVGDPIYDLAKLEHTVLAKYDIIHYGLHHTTVEKDDNSQFRIHMKYQGDPRIWKVYQRLEADLLKNIPVFYDVDQDPYWQVRLDFSLAKIMLNLPLYHLKDDGVEENALALYAEGVVLLNQFMYKYLDPAVVKPDTGGIDLTFPNMNLQIQNNDNEIKLDMGIAIFKRFREVLGFTPVIIKIQPMTDLKNFLGLKAQESALPTS